MGLCVSKRMCGSKQSRHKPAKLLMVGLDDAGKTTLLYQLTLNQLLTTVPTIGFNVETVIPVKGLTFAVWDIGGQDKIRPLWRYYFENSQGLFYVVDSADRERLQESRDEMHRVLEADDMRGLPVVVLANKQDLPGAVSVVEVANALDLNKLCSRKWHVQGTSAATGHGVFEAMTAMARMVTEFNTSLSQFNFQYSKSMKRTSERAYV